MATIASNPSIIITPPQAAHPEDHPLLAHIAAHVAVLVECPQTPQHTRHRRIPRLSSFIRQVYGKCRLTPTILVVALIYLERLQERLPQGSQGEFDTPHKLFLSSIILSSKFLEDVNPIASTLYHFVSPIYTPRDLCEMERSFLGILKFDLFVSMSQMHKFVESHSLEQELNLLA